MSQTNLRGTKEFRLEFTDQMNWEDGGWGLIGEGILPDARDLQADCQVPMSEIILDPPQVRVRYLRFTAISYYGVGPALQYLEIA